MPAKVAANARGESHFMVERVEIQSRWNRIGKEEGKMNLMDGDDGWEIGN